MKKNRCVAIATELFFEEVLMKKNEFIGRFLYGLLVFHKKILKKGGFFFESILLCLTFIKLKLINNTYQL